MEDFAPGEAYRRIRIEGREAVIHECEIYDAEYVLGSLGLSSERSDAAQALPSAPIGKRRMFSGKQLIKYLDRLFEEGATDGRQPDADPAVPPADGPPKRPPRRPRRS